MRASAIEFRLRMLINLIIIVLGFWAPWAATWGPSVEFVPRIALLQWLAIELSRTGAMSFLTATQAVIVCGALIAAVGAVLRVWGTAYLGTRTVLGLEMKAGAVMADGPYRYLRNPLYAGFWFMTLALAFLMPPTGALVCMILITIFGARLILGEEAFLAAKLGDPYLAYRHAVPRLFPRLRGAPAAAGSKPQWLRSFFAELTPVGVFVALAFFSWSYDNRLMGRVVLIAFGASLVARAFMLGPPKEQPAAE
jgi:protein-S-isoprenylcysteine O-methyltransferase Ste14